MTLVATSSQTVGPFFHFGLTPDEAVNASPLPEGVPRLAVTVRVTDGEGQPVGDAAIEIFYSAAGAAAGPCLFARLPTSPDGTCTFEVAQPANHVNVCCFARGLLRHLHTRIYFEGHPGLATDAVLARVPAERRPTLLARPVSPTGHQWHFDLRLQGPDETVFFDL